VERSKALGFARRVKRIEVSAIKQMPLLARSVPDAVSLGQGIPSVRTPEYIRRQVIELLKHDADIGKYSLQPGVPELKQSVAQKIAQTAGRFIDPELEVFISAGAMEALFAAVVSLVDEGDEVILFDPSYASHIEQVKFASGTPVFVPLIENDGWALDEELLRRAVSAKTKAVIVCNPGNPTGKVFSVAELSVIVKIAREHGLYIIADETYDFLVYDGFCHKSLASFSNIKDMVILCGSFSKEFAMTGWRVGYMVAPAEVIEQALKVHDAAVICAPTVSQYAALAALTNRAECKEETVRDVLARRRELICARLDSLAEFFSYVQPGGAYYVLPRYLKWDINSAEFAHRLLFEAKVITIPGAAFGPGGETHVRMSYGGTEDDINKAFDRIEHWSRMSKRFT